MQHRLRVFKNRALKKILGGRKKQETGKYCKIKGLRNLYCSLNIVWLTKSRRMRLGGGQKRNKRNAYRILVGKPKGKRRPEDLGIDEQIIFKRILKK
jgi:hypothetical protein